MRVFIKSLMVEIKYIVLNYVVCNIPFWPLRKLIYQLFGLKIGKGSRILMKTVILSPQNIVIGTNSFINERCFIDGRGMVTIGDNTTIAVFSKIITGGHNIDDEQFSYIQDEVYIGNNVAIFANSVVLGGASIEDGCVFSASSLIRRGTYYKGNLYAGNPAVLIRERKSSFSYKQDTWHPIFR